MTKTAAGFTLVEVLIALAITAFVATIAYTSLSTALTGVEATRAVAARTYEVSRAWLIISRDLRQFAPRPVRDEFGDTEPALQGGTAARFALSLTRAGWHNPHERPRSTLQRVNYRLQDDALWRDIYPVLDRVGDTQTQSVKLLDNVEDLQLAFLASLAQIPVAGSGVSLDTRNWTENWTLDTSAPGGELPPPVAVEITLRLGDWGEMRRLYELPPL